MSYIVSVLIVSLLIASGGHNRNRRFVIDAPLHSCQTQQIIPQHSQCTVTDDNTNKVSDTRKENTYSCGIYFH